MDYVIREIKKEEYVLLNDFLYDSNLYSRSVLSHHLNQ